MPWEEKEKVLIGFILDYFKEREEEWEEISLEAYENGREKTGRMVERVTVFTLVIFLTAVFVLGLSARYLYLSGVMGSFASAVLFIISLFSTASLFWNIYGRMGEKYVIPVIREEVVKVVKEKRPDIYLMAESLTEKTNGNNGMSGGGDGI